MKKSTKILLVLFVLVTIPALVLGSSIFAGIQATENGFVFNFDTKGIIAIILSVASVLLGTILYLRFLMSLSLERVLFFSSVPLIVIYGATMFLIAEMSNLNNNLALSVRSVLNLSQENLYNTVLWAILVTLLFIVLLSVNYFFICKPVNKVEKIVSRLGDGKVKENNLQVGGSKQFKNIEHSLNKINNNYKEKDNSLKKASLSQKDISRQCVRFFGKSNIEELERGALVSKKATLMVIKLESKEKTLESDYKLLDSYLNEIVPVIKRFGGFIIKYLGEGIEIVFQTAEDALDCSLAVSRLVRIKNKSAINKFKEKISIYSCKPSFKLNEEKKELDIVSNEQEVLAKMDKIIAFLQVKIIFTKSCLDDLPLRYKFAYRYLGNINFYNGKDILLFEKIDVYPKEVLSKLVKNKGLFERGVICYDNGEYQKALNYFQEYIKNYPEDNAGYIYFNNAKDRVKNS